MSKAAQGFSPEAYFSTSRMETRGLRLVEPTPRRENAAHRKNNHLWMETKGFPRSLSVKLKDFLDHFQCSIDSAFVVVKDFKCFFSYLLSFLLIS